jgi:hypothetical protein
MIAIIDYQPTYARRFGGRKGKSDLSIGNVTAIVCW